MRRAGARALAAGALSHLFAGGGGDKASGRTVGGVTAADALRASGEREQRGSGRAGVEFRRYFGEMQDSFTASFV